MDIVNRNEVRPFITKDGSLIREVLSPRNSSIRRQSLAEATVKPGQSTDQPILKVSASNNKRNLDNR